MMWEESYFFIKQFSILCFLNLSQKIHGQGRLKVMATYCRTKSLYNMSVIPALGRQGKLNSSLKIERRKKNRG